MFLRRIGNAAVALFGLLAPLLFVYAILLLLLPSPQTSPTLTPNPAAAPKYLLGPSDVLVYYDPWFAGTIRIWLNLWFAVGSLFVMLVFFAWPFANSRPYNGALALAALSLFIGLLASSPWWYCLCIA